MTKVCMTRASQSRNGCNWYTKWTHAKIHLFNKLYWLITVLILGGLPWMPEFNNQQGLLLRYSLGRPWHYNIYWCSRWNPFLALASTIMFWILPCFILCHEIWKKKTCWFKWRKGGGEREKQRWKFTCCYASQWSWSLDCYLMLKLIAKSVTYTFFSSTNLEWLSSIWKLYLTLIEM